MINKTYFLPLHYESMRYNQVMCVLSVFQCKDTRVHIENLTYTMCLCQPAYALIVVRTMTIKYKNLVKQSNGTLFTEGDGQVKIAFDKPYY